MKLILALLFPILLTSQTYCSPYHNIDRYEVNKDIIYSIAYISCFHARGVNVEMGTDKIQVGSILMGKNHHNASYLYLVGNRDYKNLRLYGGLLYRINNNPTLCIGRYGVDIEIYRNVYSTFSVSQINRNLNYANFGLKLIL